MCFRYGLIGHSQKECHQKDFNIEHSFEYGEWMSATILKKNNGGYGTTSLKEEARSRET